MNMAVVDAMTTMSQPMSSPKSQISTNQIKATKMSAAALTKIHATRRTS